MAAHAPPKRDYNKPRAPKPRPVVVANSSDKSSLTSTAIADSKIRKNSPASIPDIPSSTSSIMDANDRFSYWIELKDYLVFI